MESKIKNFKDLNSWKEAHSLVIMIYKTTQNFPSEEKFGLTNQIRRAVVSVSSNIAEGFGRSTQRDKMNFFVMAKSSLYEVENQILIAFDLEYIGNENFQQINKKIETVGKLISGLLKTAESWKTSV